jgi:hypothetical protein
VQEQIRAGLDRQPATRMFTFVGSDVLQARLSP